VVRPRDGTYQVALILVASAKGERWQLPKGWVEQGEDAAAAALREVREETGLAAEIIEPLPEIDYWFFQGKGLRVHKYVIFYLMRATGGRVDDHDHEVDTARWFPIAAAADALAFDDERDLVREAQQRLEDRPQLLDAESAEQSESPARNLLP
jgi:ADP-ribose pyrophosphatase YjhB (NUDIX family)